MNKFWKNKKVLITGHSGFKGSWLATWLNFYGSKICGISLPPENPFNLFNKLMLKDKIYESHFLDICNLSELTKIVNSFKPEITFHLAAQPLVLTSYKKPLLTWETNVIGTANLLNSLSNLNTKSTLVVITTDKVYENKEWIYGYKENDQLGGHDPYSASKAAVEILVNSWRKSFCQNQKNERLKIATARAGNVIGGGDWSQNRLIPDSISALLKNEKIKIRNPQSTRPWQHVLEPLSGYLILAEKLDKSYEDIKNLESPFNFGPNNDSEKKVIDVIKQLTELWEGDYLIQNNANKPHESSLLKLDIKKAKEKLNWEPKWDLEKTLKKTIEWYKDVHINNLNAYECSLSNIKDYIKE